ncbi:GNAT family N-acetyltransferase [Adhaeretor mobilis]|uniref:Putative acetyltransferase n=1 Tax=Adhaeretor mobilis TaxID=1930276 RepID=A0A517MU36_9BACT|nr:GNAT family N-acetyltransferase [Adhaeretor mobilis]QDS98287.1 putative acetyltransferase [Adhaeretor mobilis]
MIRFSPLHPRDTPELLELWNRCAPYDPLTEQLMREKVWGDYDFDEELSLLALNGDAPVAIAHAVVRQLSAERRGYMKLLGVAPEFRRQGVGQEIVLKLHGALVRRGAETIRVGESAPNYLVPGVDTRYDCAAKFFESLGYTKIGEATNLTAPLAGRDFTTDISDSALGANGLAIRRADANDRESLEKLLKTYWPTWNAEVATAMSCDPRAVHIALKGNQVVGFSAYDGNNRGTGWFGPMGTHPEFRGLGIGKILLRCCLHDLQSQGHARAIIPWVSPTGLYANQVGATVDRTFNRYEFCLGERTSTEMSQKATTE